MPMTTSAAGRAAITAREGCRLDAYRDSAGVPTIGVGHTGRACPPAVAMGMTITAAEADAILERDLATFEAAVNRAVTVPMTQNQFDSCVSLAFNIGTGGFAGSTVVHKLNTRDPAGAADAFLMWDRPPELRGRRNGERAQFLRPDASIEVAAQVQVTAPARPTAPPVAGPHLLPPPSAPGFWARLAALFSRKAPLA